MTWSHEDLTWENVKENTTNAETAKHELGKTCKEIHDFAIGPTLLSEVWVSYRVTDLKIV